MTIYSFPEEIKFSNATWALVTNTQVWVSPFSNQTQVKEMNGAQWAATFSCPALKREERAVVEAFLARLRGASGKFYAHNPINDGVLGAGGGSPKVAGVGQTGTSLITDGWPTETLVLKAGDEFQVGQELKRLVEDATSDAGGVATLVFEPPLRNTPTDNDDIVIDKPTCVMRLVDDNQVTVSQGVDGFAEISFSAVEVIE